jgi:hypothetical protein
MAGIRFVLVGLTGVLSLSSALPAAAVTVDFEDLAAATYNVGGSFNSNGIPFNVIAYNGGGSMLGIQKSGTPTNTRLSAFNTTGVNVGVPSGTGMLAFDFSDGCSGCSHIGITVNGAASDPTVQLVDLNKTTLGGVQISVLPSSAAGFQARLRLEGPIMAFATGGTEYWFDNLVMRVPEPTTATMVVFALGSLASWRRRHP